MGSATELDLSSAPVARKEFISKIVEWAKLREDIRGVLCIGSAARVTNPADSLSDIDLILITETPEFYIEGSDWLAHFGRVLLTFVEDTAVGGQKERRVLYEGGQDIDFAIFPLAAAHYLAEYGPPAELQEVFWRGFTVLLDKDGLLSQTEIHSQKVTPPPTQDELDLHMNDFLYHAVWAAKKLRRGEIWVGKQCVDVYMKRLLLRAVEWKLRALRGWEYDTWFEGRFLENWATVDVILELKKTFALYDLESVKAALLATVLMHRRLMTEIAERLGLSSRGSRYSKIIELVGCYTA